MRVPNSINLNTLKAYEIHPRNTSKERQNLKSYNLEQWDERLPKTLREICVETIAKNWKDKPILDEIVLSIDRYLLIDILPTHLPLHLTIPKINDDMYWMRCYAERWPLNLPHDVKPLEIFEVLRSNNTRTLSNSCNGNNAHGKSSTRGSTTNVAKIESRDKLKRNNPDQRNWKEFYIEMHMKEYLESLKPEQYDAEKMKELSDLCSSYIKVLKIDQLQSSEDSETRVPLNSILTGFQNLQDLSLCFKQTYAGEQFTWDVLKTSFQDIQLLAKVWKN
ncbi:hypothetical protein NQ317_003787 [Molorchus minor]|uniref:Uncharacterized protein n=1 Tax=Molorchus minor TaxID=1323400 RepID=A0ABQ9JVJ2_9CUCU|nr:hypothetical protein NQ317_003787 [Molorchus minor]